MSSYPTTPNSNSDFLSAGHGRSSKGYDATSRHAIFVAYLSDRVDLPDDMHDSVVLCDLDLSTITASSLPFLNTQRKGRRAWRPRRPQRRRPGLPRARLC
jgi:hypothetical protein